ncbi:MAG: sigma-54-dependent Fis family transcriptional regulator [Candidatus Aenigmarchaeota archaeon]|nr:sigma-54-dependent Fis family transcriptional regulator [Candidatus Aenigmarchaeota archaeon]
MVGIYSLGSVKEPESVGSRLKTRRIGFDPTEKPYGPIIGNSPPMLDIYRFLDRLAARGYSDKNEPKVLIQGESGTGKELLAAEVCRRGGRSRRPFIAVNCGSIPPELAEAEFFGHQEGAFTGAVTASTGVFREANYGTLFLDEVGELRPDHQTKLLRVLQNGEVKPVGSPKTTKVDVRVIAATNQDLKELVDAGKFRRDLYYRLAVLDVTMPPLRERGTDIDLLAIHFLELVSKEQDSEKSFAPDALQVLRAYNWPGNVRELENIVQRAYYLSSGKQVTGDEVRLSLGPNRICDPDVDDKIADLARSRLPIENLKRRYTVSLLDQMVLIEGMTLDAAVAVLGIGKSTLYRDLEIWGLKGRYAKHVKRGPSGITETL